MLNRSCENRENEKMKAAARTFEEEFAVALARRSPTAWEVPFELDATQVMEGQNLHFLYTVRGLWAELKVPPQSARRVVFGAREWAVFHRPKSLVS